MMRVMGAWTVAAREIAGIGTIVTPGAGGEIEMTITLADIADATTTTATDVGGIIGAKGDL
jgi:hypothetical protein